MRFLQQFGVYGGVIFIVWVLVICPRLKNAVLSFLDMFRVGHFEIYEDMVDVSAIENVGGVKLGGLAGVECF